MRTSKYAKVTDQVDYVMLTYHLNCFSVNKMHDRTINITISIFVIKRLLILLGCFNWLTMKLKMGAPVLWNTWWGPTFRTIWVEHKTGTLPPWLSWVLRFGTNLIEMDYWDKSALILNRGNFFAVDQVWLVMIAASVTVHEQCLERNFNSPVLMSK